MLMTSFSPDTLGAVLDVAGFLCVVVMVWAIFAFSMTTPTSALAPMQPLQTAMTPLEMDLAQVETFPALSAVTTATTTTSSSPCSSSAVVDELRAELAALEEEQAGALVDRRGVNDEWPPAPIGRPGAKRYRYVNVRGRLVKLSDLVEAAAWPPSKAMLN